jgi:hypothetical protein
LSDRVDELDEQDTLPPVEDDCAHGRPVDRLEPVPERLEPPQTLGVRNGSVRRRGRGQDEEADVAERALLRAELRTFAEDSAKRLLPDERDRTRLELARHPLQSRPVEVCAAEVAGARRRPCRGVRQTDPLLQNLELLARLVEPRGQAGRREQPPEVVARVGEVRPGGRGHVAGVDPAEDDPQPGSEDVGDGATCSVPPSGVAGRRAAHGPAAS